MSLTPEPLYSPSPQSRLAARSVPVSVTIIAKNEASNLAACLESVAFAEQVVVVDAESTDATAWLARSHGADVYVRPWPGYTLQRNFSIAQCRHNWILSIDADERVSLRLAHEIARLMQEGPKFSAYRVPELNNYFGRWLKHGGIRPGYHISLFDRRKGLYQEGLADVHEDVHFTESGILSAPVLHFAYPDFKLALEKLNRYTGLEAEGRRKRGLRSSAYGLFWRPAERFIKNYFFKFGFLDGWQGFLYAFLCAFYPFCTEIKLRELEKNPNLSPQKASSEQGPETSFADDPVFPRSSTMKRMSLFLIASALAFSLSAHSADQGDGNQDAGKGNGKSQNQVHSHGSQGQPAKAPQLRQGHARSKAASGPVVHPRSPAANPRPYVNLGRKAVRRDPDNRSQRPSNVAHRVKARPADLYHTRLKVLGIVHAPQLLPSRGHILDTDRRHSVIKFPTRGPSGAPLLQVAVTARQWNDPLIRTHMGLWASPDRIHVALGFNATETVAGRYYWHHDPGFEYCHYLDPWGYHWYGWYVGDRHFWTRYYQDRWWFYDNDLNRWNFWNNGAWWWQDPYHVGDLYLYDDGSYVQAAPDEDSDSLVSTVEPPDAKTYRSGDNSRLVKLMGDSRDAFLYDTAIPPSFNPIYLASKVKEVKFSDTDNGKPLQIMLTLDDGSFDLFDAEGNPMNEAAP